MTSADLPDRCDKSARAQFDDAVCVVGTHLRMQDALAALAGNPFDGAHAGVVEGLLRHQVPRARAALSRLAQVRQQEGDR